MHWDSPLLQLVATMVKKNNTALIVSLSALNTEAVNNLVLEICLESVFPGQRLLNLTEQVFGTFFGLATF